MNVKTFVRILDADFFAGVPDSQLRALCDYLVFTYGNDPQHHIIAANEGNAAALAAGYHLATGKIPVVYMQNSGEGNIINPVASLTSPDVYAIPTIFVVGWRGQPGLHDEPQHVYQGKVTLKLLEDMAIPAFVIAPETSADDMIAAMRTYRSLLAQGKSVAFVICKGALTYDKKVQYHNSHDMRREEIIRHITAVSGCDPIVSTTGKASRELFETREKNKEGHNFDFLTVGSMGHSSSIALGIALHSRKKIWCIDGDGAALMHMGAMAVIGDKHPANLVHVIINNEAHESVGGMPTVASRTDFCKIAAACGYAWTASAGTYDELDKALQTAKENRCLSLIEVKCAIGARDDLGRPTTTPQENKQHFMEHLTAR